MKFLKSGFMPFLIGCVIIIIYYFLISNYKVGGDIYGSVSAFNIIFTILFIVSCCTAAYIYGRKNNKSGLRGLICIFTPYFISIIFLLIIPSQYLNLPQFILMPLYYTFFCYVTLFLAPNIMFAVAAPVILIIFIICAWFIGKRNRRIF